MRKEFIVHVRKNDDDTWASPHNLVEHLKNTARIAEINAAKYHSGEWCKDTGLAHDDGKGRVIPSHPSWVRGLI